MSTLRLSGSTRITSSKPRVFIPAQLRELTHGTLHVDIDGETVRDVVDALEVRFPGIRARLCQGDSLSPALQISIDSVMSAKGLRAKLKPESELHFLPAFGGG